MDTNIKEVIKSAIKEILEQRTNRSFDLRDELRLIGDLGFSSLDLAQLVARLEIELGIDPFSNGVPLSSVQCISDLYRVYQSADQK